MRLLKFTATLRMWLGCACCGMLYGQTPSQGVNVLTISPSTSGYLGRVNLTNPSNLTLLAGQIIPLDPNTVTYAQGAAYISSAWVAQDTSASLVTESAGTITFYSNTGLTVGSSFTPTAVLTVAGATTFVTPSNFDGSVAMNAGVVMASSTAVPLTINQVTTHPFDLFDVEQSNGSNLLSVSPSGGGAVKIGAGLYLDYYTAATSGSPGPFSSPCLTLGGTYWGGLSSNAASYNICDVIGTGTSPSNTLNLTANGGSTYTVQVDNLNITGTCTGCGGGGSGTVTSVGLTGTANEITVTGASPITASGSFTLSLPSTVDFPGSISIPSGGSITVANSASTSIQSTSGGVTAGLGFFTTGTNYAAISAASGGVSAASLFAANYTQTGQASATPTLTSGQSGFQPGAQYWNTSSGNQLVYNNSAWVAMTPTTVSASCGTITGNSSGGTIDGTSCVSSPLTITFGMSAPTGWSCVMNNLTAIAFPSFTQTGYTANSATFANDIIAGATSNYVCSWF